jgi:dTDP-glucose 4,6-dehydratase
MNPMICKLVGNVDYIFHLAAGSHVDRSIEYPMEFVLDNVVGTVNVLEFARKVPNLQKFVYFSTDEVFGPAPIGVKYKERDRYNSTNPYSASKAGGEEMCVAYENTYGLPVIITHTMNVFGERQHPEKFIPLCIRRIRDGETIHIHSNREKTKAGTRHYIHATDVADGLIKILNVDVSQNDIAKL